MELDDIIRQKIQLNEEIEELRKTPDVQRFLALEDERLNLDRAEFWRQAEKQGWVSRAESNDYGATPSHIGTIAFNKVRHLLED